MTIWKFTVCPMIAGLALTSTALAADIVDTAVLADPVMRADMIFDWTGFYAGINAGYGMGTLYDGNGNTVVTEGTFIDDVDGLIGGIQLGYNYNFGGFVLGIETDLQASAMQQSVFIPARQETGRVELDYFGTVRARAGVAVDRALIYGTGGLAYGQAAIGVTPAGSVSPSSIDREALIGYTLGAGLEYAVSDKISIKSEYLYTDFGKETYHVFGNSFDRSLDFHTVRIGVNFHF